MNYIKIQFTAGLACQAYQEVDANGLITRYCDLEGGTLEVPDASESHVLDPAPPRPSWAE